MKVRLWYFIRYLIFFVNFKRQKGIERRDSLYICMIIKKEGVNIMAITRLEKQTEDELKRVLKEKKDIYMVYKKKGGFNISVVRRAKGFKIGKPYMMYEVLNSVDLKGILELNESTDREELLEEVLNATSRVFKEKKTIAYAVDNILNFFSNSTFLNCAKKDVIPYLEGTDDKDGRYVFIVG